MTRNQDDFPNRCILILLDGLGDRSYQRFNNQTPLQAAKTPNLDRLAAEGANGLFHATYSGQPLSSETAHFIMFGYDLADFPGRGILEAIGEQIAIKTDEVALLSHFVSLRKEGEHLILENGKPELSEHEYSEFSKEINQYSKHNLHVEFFPTGGIRGILKIGPESHPGITDTDPFFESQLLIEPIPLKEFESHPPTIRTATSLKDYLTWASERLTQHPLNQKRISSQQLPINGLVTQRAGQIKPCVPFLQKNGIKGLSISSNPMYKGLCQYIGMDFIPAHDSNNSETDLKESLKQANELLAKYDFIHVHTKWPDKAAHTKNPQFKKEVIEALDRAIGSEIENPGKDPNTLIVIAADHSTPSEGPLVHSGEPVPILFLGKGMRRDTVSSFNEIDAATGALGFIRGKEFMAMILNSINKAKLQGIMQTATDCPTWTTAYQPFKLS